MLSKVAICNLALANLGTRNTIQSLNENSTESKACNQWYDIARISTLEGYDWSFAKKRVALAVSSEAAPEGIWAFRYVYPADCLAARRMQQPSYLSTPLILTDAFDASFPDPDAIPFEVEMESDGESKSILTDLEDAILVYTFDQENTGLFSKFFSMTLSYGLAYYMAIQLTGRKSFRDDNYALFTTMLGLASEHDANERVDKKPRESEMIRARWS